VCTRTRVLHGGAPLRRQGQLLDTSNERKVRYHRTMRTEPPSGPPTPHPRFPLLCKRAKSVLADVGWHALSRGRAEAVLRAGEQAGQEWVEGGACAGKCPLVKRSRGGRLTGPQGKNMYARAPTTAPHQQSGRHHGAPTGSHPCAKGGAGKICLRRADSNKQRLLRGCMARGRSRQVHPTAVPQGRTKEPTAVARAAGGQAR
jgi:hypothetical protein